jgi:DNA-binding MarR family transcriptional regulator
MNGPAPEPHDVRALAGLLADAARTLASAEREELEALGLTPGPFRLLDRLAEAGPLAPSTAASALGVTRPTVTAWAKYLQNAGFLSRDDVDGDARRALLAPSAEGSAVHRRARERVRRRHLRLLAAAVEPNAQADLLDALRRIAAADG